MPTTKDTGMNWTTEIPTEPGFYWHRYTAEETPHIIEIGYLGDDNDPDGLMMTTTGSEIPSAKWMGEGNEITGEFWPQRLTPP